MNFPRKPLHEGDIVFRRGTGLASRAVLTVDRKGVYSHVGVVVNDNGVWKVVHAVPGESEEGEPDKVKMELLGDFFAPDRAIVGAVMRTDADSLVTAKVARKAISLYRNNVLFDHKYDMNDTTELYCSELVEFVYLHLGIDLVEGKYSEVMIPGFAGLYLLPSDILNSSHLKLVEIF